MSENVNLPDPLRRVLESALGPRAWSDEELLAIAADPAHPRGERFFDYHEGKLTGAEREELERHEAGCAFCLEQFAEIGVLVREPAVEPFLLRLRRKVGETWEEVCRLVADRGAEALRALGDLAPEVKRIQMAGTMEAGGPPDPEHAKYHVVLPLAEGGLQVLLVVDRRGAEAFDLQLFALDLSGGQFVGVTARLEGPAGRVELVSDASGRFARPGEAPGALEGLPFGAYRLHLRRPTGEEYAVDLPDLADLLRRGTGSNGGQQARTLAVGIRPPRPARDAGGGRPGGLALAGTSGDGKA